MDRESGRNQHCVRLRPSRSGRYWNENTWDGLLLGALYLACRRNLAAPVIAHGMTDTIDFGLIDLGKYPGMKQSCLSLS
jgi:hypothetical protein